MKLYFAGAESEMWNNLRLSMGVKKFLQSYYHLKNQTPIKGVDHLLDSGGFTARTRGTAISVEKYSEYINANSVKIAFNLDTNSVEETIQNQDYLIRNCPGCYIIPIFHFSDFENHRYLLDDFIKFPYISVGGLVGVSNKNEQREVFLNYVFSKTTNKIRVHGLGVTGEKDMLRYPFYSVDSTSWLVSARYGGSHVEKNKKIIKIQNKERPYLERSKKEIKHYLDLEKQITNIWKARGVEWTEFQK